MKNTLASDSLVKLDNVGVFKNNKWLVQGVSFEISKGQILTLIGPNGSGKTTTAKVVLGIHKNIEGQAQVTAKNISYVPQKITIDWTLPVRVKDFMIITQNLREEDIEKALKLTESNHLINKSLRDLSGGEFQRVLLARAISRKPDLLVLDEPVQGVDFTGEIALYQLIKKISSTLQCGILLISHDLHVVMSATDYVVCLNGHVCCSGTPKNIVKNKKYQELFGEHVSQTLSFYEHKHDHAHTADGDIKKNHKNDA